LLCFFFGGVGDGISKIICLAWPQISILPISASKAARIMGVSYGCPANAYSLLRRIPGTQQVIKMLLIIIIIITIYYPLYLQLAFTTLHVYPCYLSKQRNHLISYLFLWKRLITSRNLKHIDIASLGKIYCLP
jgi:hypothetical protein